jgi:hypothetical protein
MIDIANPRAPSTVRSRTEEMKYDVYLRNLHRRYFYKFYPFKIRRGFRTEVYTPVRNFIERNFPRLFRTLKKVKDRRRL